MLGFIFLWGCCVAHHYTNYAIVAIMSYTDYGSQHCSFAYYNYISKVVHVNSSLFTFTKFINVKCHFSVGLAGQNRINILLTAFSVSLFTLNGLELFLSKSSSSI